jgi:hypothetical protein
VFQRDFSQFENNCIAATRKAFHKYSSQQKAGQNFKHTVSANTVESQHKFYRPCENI